MSLLTHVIKALEKIAPLSLAHTKWDNVGLLVEPPYPRSSATSVFLTIDLTPIVLEEAISTPSVGMIVAYHPPIFHAFKQLNLNDTKQSIVLKCIAEGISVYSPHTAIDCSVGGVNDWLAKGLGSGTSISLMPRHEEAGAGRLFTLEEPVSLSTVVKRIKNHLKLKHGKYKSIIDKYDDKDNNNDLGIRVATAEKHRHNDGLISTIGICAGSGVSVLSPAKADLYFTGEMSHHEVLAALAKDTSEHTNTERGYLSEVLKPKLEKLLKEDGDNQKVDILVSQSDKDPLEII
ncbi:538_t:CDS:2 [Entrophospora sp. SA101]|nr:538_t:CDS:2 [Entrophospora sp. SA101]CAJ0830764.1 3348_t:CDS:2 [Entrophospora sp. SA101]